MRRRGSLVAAGCAVVVVACGSDRLTGTTIETENLQARVLRVDSLLPSWNRPDTGATVAALRFDETNFHFERAPDSGRGLHVERLDSTPIPFEVVYWDRVARKGRLHVRLARALRQSATSIRLRWDLADSVAYAQKDSTWMGVSDSLREAIGSVAVADFESKNDTSLLPTKPRWSFSAAESSSVGPWTFEPAGGTRGGTALSVTYSTTGASYAVVQTNLVKDASYRSLRGIDSLVFWVKGTKGSGMFVAFDCGDLFKSWQFYILDSVWTRIRIRPSDLTPASNTGGGNRGWEAVRDSVSRLSFILNNGQKVWLDDIRLHGVNRDDLR